MSESVAIVTGAGSGVGERVARMLSGAGWRVVLVGRTADTLKAVAGVLPGESRIISADVGVSADRARIIEGTLERFGRIDALVNNAGLAIYKPVDRHDEDSMMALFNVNGIGPVDLARRVIPSMLEQKSGVVVSVASMANIDPFPGLGMYGCAKGALSVLPKAIVNEYGKRGIRAYTICPGAIETGMLRSMFSEKQLPESATLDPEFVAERVVGCVTGEEDEPSGSVIAMPSH